MTVANILKEHGLGRADRRNSKSSWHTFLRSRWECLEALDFLTVELWTLLGLITYYVLLAMEIGKRRIEIVGITPCPGEAFMAQVTRNLTDEFECLFQGKRYAIMDQSRRQIHARLLPYPS